MKEAEIWNHWHERVRSELHIIESRRGPPYASNVIESVTEKELIAVVLNIIYADKRVRMQVQEAREERNHVASLNAALDDGGDE